MSQRSLLPWFIALFSLGLLVGYVLATEAQVARARPASEQGAKAAPTVVKKLNADFVDGIHAAKTPAAKRLLPLDQNLQFPGSVIPNTLGHDLNVNNLIAGAPAHADCNTGGDVCGDDDVVADDDVTAGDDVEVGGDLEQSLAGDGSVKAALFVLCTNTQFATIYRSFVTVSGYTGSPTITPGISTGKCVIDFGFNVIDRYVIVHAPHTGLGLAQAGATFHYLSDNSIEILRTNSSGSAQFGPVFVLVY